MTAILKLETLDRTVQIFRDYHPDWSRNTMTTVNEMTSQFYGWLPSVDSIIPSTQGDPVTWVLLGIIGIILVYKL